MLTKESDRSSFEQFRSSTCHTLKDLGNDYFARQREAEREMRSAYKKDVAHLSGSSIMRIDGALWMTTIPQYPYSIILIQNDY